MLHVVYPLNKFYVRKVSKPMHIRTVCMGKKDMFIVLSSFFRGILNVS